MVDTVQQLRMLRAHGQQHAQYHGRQPVVEFTNDSNHLIGISIFVFTAFVVFIGGTIGLL